MSKVSVLMTVFNDGNRYLIESIQSILNQSYRNLEIILVNDGSTDNSAQVIESLIEYDSRVKFINRKTNKGRSYSLNEGLEQCSGDFICINDADDLSILTRVEESINFFNNQVVNKDIFGVLGTAFTSNDVTKGEKYHHTIKYGSFFKKKVPIWRILIGMPFPHSSFMYSKKALESVGGFSTEVTSGIDYLTLLKIANRFDIYGINEILVERIIDGENYFMQGKINKQNEKNKQIIEKWQRDNIKFYYIKKIPYLIYQSIKG